MTASAESIFQEAIAAHRRGALDEARRFYAEILRLDPRNDAARGNLAIIMAEQGDLLGAETLFRQALALRPNDPVAWNNLGSTLQQQGKLADAVMAHRRAITLMPGYAEAWLALGSALMREDRIEEALAAFRDALRLRPRYAEASNNLGIILQRQGKLDEALAACRNAVAWQPAYAEAHFNIGVILHEQRDLAAAAAAYRHVVALRPDLAEAYNNLGTVLQELGLYAEALGAFDQAIGLRHHYAEAHFNRGVVLHRQGSLEQASAAFRNAIALRKDYVEAINNAAVVLQELGRADDALAGYRLILAIKPADPEAHNNLGAALLAQGRPEEALGELQQALRLRSDYPEAYYNLGNAWRALGRLEGAIAAYETALRLRPDFADAFSQLFYHRRQACDWHGEAADEKRLLDIVRSGAARVPPFYLVATSASPRDQLDCARRWIAPLLPPPEELFRHEVSRDRDRIRLGYLSADFHEHATASLAVELFERHDRTRFEVIAYSHGRDDGSPLRRRLERAFDRFVDIRALPHRAAAERINADAIDILIDLKGYTLDARPRIAAYRPAPIQVAWLGFPATTGAPFIDYIAVDSFVVPSEEQPCFTERLVHLPGCYQVNGRNREIATTARSRRDCGLPADGFVFCSFNNGYKITPDVFAIWMRLLAAVPGSVLWLLASNDLVERNLRREAETRGVEPGRLVFAPRLPLAEHLARHCHADLFLDTLPCNAHTTASDALWAGLPLLTCAGHTFAGRVAGSLLSAIDLPELITHSLEEYERAAFALARDPRRLADLREKLRRRRETSVLFDLPRFASALENAFAQMWRSMACRRVT
jgi:predicted O-linked N-acetylglucosamine transferase (SPINDLY family)